MLREAPLAADHVKNVMVKALCTCRSGDLQQLPAAMHQLLLLAQQGHKAFLLKVSIRRTRHHASATFNNSL